MQELKNLFHLIQAIIANIIYGFPSRKLKVIGVTGTDGKTTTTHLIYHILKTAGKKASMISTVYANIANKVYDTGFHVTTPDVFPLYSFLQKSVRYGDEYFVLETTSHALAQNRVYGVKYEIGVLTNVTHEHLDYHQNYENYVKTKLKLLQMAKIGVVNRDDESYKLINQKFVTYGFKNKTDYQYDFGNNIAEFNKYNFLAAYAVCRILGIEEKTILQAIKSFKLPKGRMELVYDKDFKVIIDFAHTPNAFHSVLPEIRKQYLKENGRLIHVFGAAGLRDSSKRPMMGETSSAFSDLIFLTEEDYRTENPQTICEQIAYGIKGISYKIIINRKKAIETAIGIAKKGDVIIVTGKGHEKSLCRGKTEYSWDEKKVILEAIKKYDKLRPRF